LSLLIDFMMKVSNTFVVIEHFFTLRPARFNCVHAVFTRDSVVCMERLIIFRKFRYVKVYNEMDAVIIMRGLVSLCFLCKCLPEMK